jgi:NADP-dependent 3-hydroxy acid dehydrogenase YdfG
MKVTLITGASSGIGEAFARRLAEEGHDLVLVARSEDKLRALCDELKSAHGITAHFIAIDLVDFEADRRLFQETERHGLEVDWLINNAGFGSMGDFAKLDLERELEMINLNICALVALTHRYLQPMRERNERKDHKRFFCSRLSADTVHGDLRCNQSVRNGILRSHSRREPAIRDPGARALPGIDRHEFL